MGLVETTLLDRVASMALSAEVSCLLEKGPSESSPLLSRIRGFTLSISGSQKVGEDETHPGFLQTQQVSEHPEILDAQSELISDT